MRKIARIGILICQLGWLLAGTVTGKVSKDGEPFSSESPVAIYIEDFRQAIPEPLLKKEYVISTKDKQFSPRMLVVPVGGAVRFPNNDPIAHNVFSVSADNRFDAGRYAKGQGYRQVFANPGLVRVYCNVHHRMSAVVIVTENPFFTYCNEKGEFRLEGLPPGRYTLTAIHYLAGKTSVEVEVKPEQETRTELKLATPSKEPPHLNKHGKPYERSRSKQY